MTLWTTIQSIDESVLRALRGTPMVVVWPLWVLTVVGNGWGLLPVAPFVFRASTRSRALWLLASQLAVSAVGSAIKAMVGRVRPCDALGWCQPVMIRSPGGPSFPSGHAAGAFAFATFLSMMDRRFAWVCFPIAALIALSRCVLGVHYPSDVIAGALLGSIMGYGFGRLSLRIGGRTGATARIS